MSLSTLSRNRRFLVLAAVVILPLVTYLVMDVAVETTPGMAKGYSPGAIAVTLFIILLGLAVPYGILKGFFSAARQRDINQEPLKLEDLPKDKDRIRP